MLSAYYIATWLSNKEQVSQFQQLFNQPCFAAVFQFFAAITKLKSPGICTVIAKIIETKSDPLLISLLRCLYEAQDASLCLYVAKQLKFELDVEDTTLSPLDCLAISFFLSSVNCTEISVDLDECYIGDHGAKCLAKHLCRNVDHDVGKATIDLFVIAFMKKVLHILLAYFTFVNISFYHVIQLETLEYLSYLKH